jgi:predicted small integral membrane protein
MKKLASLILLIPGVAYAQQAGWGNVGQAQEEAFSLAKWWTEPLFSGFWMAWTRATLAFFIVIFAMIAVMAILEIRRPGGDKRLGILGLETTRGDRLFIGLLGSAYVFIAWLGLITAPLWFPLAIAVAWIGFCFWKV